LTPASRDRPSPAGYFCAVAATAIWSGNFIIARGLSDNIPPVSLAFWRWTVAVAVFLPFAVRPLLAERRRLRPHLPYLCATAVLGVTLFNTLVYFAGHTTTATNLSLIAITFPVFILILSRIFLDERITLVRSAGILLVAFGVVLLITKGELSRLLNITFAIGDLWMLAASFIFAVYSLLVRRKPQTVSIWAFQLSTFLIGLLFLLPFYLWETAVVPPFDPAPRTLLSIAYVGVFASLAAFLLWNRAILLIGPSRAGMVYYTLPLFAGFAAWVFLGEAVGVLHLISLVLILGGIVMANTGGSVRKGPDEQEDTSRKRGCFTFDKR
jgi:drug/metabolite transporter (DMT)-like permease